MEFPIHKLNRPKKDVYDEINEKCDKVDKMCKEMSLQMALLRQEMRESANKQNEMMARKRKYSI